MNIQDLVEQINKALLEGASLTTEVYVSHNGRPKPGGEYPVKGVEFAAVEVPMGGEWGAYVETIIKPALLIQEGLT